MNEGEILKLLDVKYGYNIFFLSEGFVFLILLSVVSSR